MWIFFSSSHTHTQRACCSASPPLPRSVHEYLLAEILLQESNATERLEGRTSHPSPTFHRRSPTPKFSRIVVASLCLRHLYLHTPERWLRFV